MKKIKIKHSDGKQTHITTTGSDVEAALELFGFDSDADYSVE